MQIVTGGVKPAVVLISKAKLPTTKPLGAVPAEFGSIGVIVVKAFAPVVAGNVIETAPDWIVVGVGLAGVGTESGEEYRVKEQEHGSFRQTLMGATGSYRQLVRLQSRTSARSFEMVVRGHYTVNANGDLTVEREKPVVACEG